MQNSGAEIGLSGSHALSLSSSFRLAEKASGTDSQLRRALTRDRHRFNTVSSLNSVAQRTPMIP